MGDTKKTSKTTSKTAKKSWFKGLKAEFKKIIWPSKESLAKKSTAAIIVTVVVGILIALVDSVIKMGIDLVIR